MRLPCPLDGAHLQRMHTPTNGACIPISCEGMGLPAPLVNGVALGVFIFFFLLVTVLGFVAARWRRGDLNLIQEWGLAGRRFGTVVTWFLLGGDLYTAYSC